MRTPEITASYRAFLCSIPRFLLGGVVFPLTLTLSPAAHSQDNPGEGSTVVYPASYFAEFAPLTVQDMLIRIPGSIVSNRTSSSGSSSGSNASSGGRGLGSGQRDTEILINGKRTAGKNNDSEFPRIWLIT